MKLLWAQRALDGVVTTRGVQMTEACASIECVLSPQMSVYGDDSADWLSLY